MLLDIHTHRNAAVPGECIFNVEPAWFEPVEGCYYSVAIPPWKVLEAGPEDCLQNNKRCLSDKFY